jgi:hypothetical protein
MRLFSRLSNRATVAAYLVVVIFAHTATASDYLDVSGMKAIYDANTGRLRFEGLFNIHGIGIGRNDKASFRPDGAATTQASFSVANEEEAGWLFFDGIEGGSFDAGTILPTGLSDGLSDFYIGVSSIGSGKNVTPIPIYSASGVYLPNFDLYAPPPVAEMPPVIQPPISEIPLEPAIPSEPAAPPVVELPVDTDLPVVTIEEPELPIDSGPIVEVINEVTNPGFVTWEPVRGEYTFPIWNSSIPHLELQGLVLQYVDLADFSFNGIVDADDPNAYAVAFTSHSATQSNTSLSDGFICNTLPRVSEGGLLIPEPGAIAVGLPLVVVIALRRRRD